jgi:hypothetical protein
MGNDQSRGGGNDQSRGGSVGGGGPQGIPSPKEGQSPTGPGKATPGPARVPRDPLYHSACPARLASCQSCTTPVLFESRRALCAPVPLTPPSPSPPLPLLLQ